MFHRRRFMKACGASGIAGMTAISGCLDGSDDEITIGFLSPMTGPGAFAGENAQMAVNLAVDEINSVGVLDQEITLNTQDTETDPQEALSGYQTLVADDVACIVGASSFTIPNLIDPVLSDEIPLVTPFATTGELNDIGGDWIWRTQTNDVFIGRALGTYADEVGMESMAIAIEQERGTISLADIAVERFQELGGTVTEEIDLPADADSYRGEVDQMLASDPDVIVLSALEDVGSLFVQNFFESGSDLPLMISDEITNQNFADRFDADAIDGTIGITLAPGPAGDAFADKYADEYDEQPGPFADSSYDALNLVASAIELAGSEEPGDIVDGFREIGGPPGTEVTTYPDVSSALENGEDVNLTGAATPLNFNEYGDVLGPVAVQEVDAATWETTEVLPEDDLID